MELAYVGLFDASSLEVLCEADDWEGALSASGRSRALEVVRCSGGGLAPGGTACRPVGALTVSLFRGEGGASGVVAALAARQHSAAVAAALLRALAAVPAAGGGDARARVRAVVARYLGDAAALSPGAGKLTSLQTALDRLKDAARASAEDLLERGERLDSLVARSDALAVRSQGFRMTAKDLRAAAQQPRPPGGCCGAGGGGGGGGSVWPALLLAIAGSATLAFLVLRLE
jgi:hypothetical protein